LSRRHDDLPAMMRFMRDEIREHVTGVERQIPPDVLARRRNAAVVLAREAKESSHRIAAAIQCCDELSALHAIAIDSWRRVDTVR